MKQGRTLLAILLALCAAAALGGGNAKAQGRPDNPEGLVQLSFARSAAVSGPQAPPNRVVGDHKANTLLVADFDADGLVDAAVVNSYDARVVIFGGRGGGRFALRCTVDVDRRPIGLTAGDWNADGRLDLAVTSYNQHGASVLIGDGKGCPRYASHIDAGNAPQAMASGDWDGDGRLDFVVSNRNDHTVAFLHGSGDGGFSVRPDRKGTVGVGRFPSGVVVGDWNGDHALDAAVVNHYGHSVSILLGDGKGRFILLNEIAVGLFPGDIDAADLDKDGRPDLVVVNVRNNDLSVLKGAGDGSFAETERLLTGEAPAGIAIADFDGDGYPDIAATMRDQPEVVVFRNQLGAGGGFRRAFAADTGGNPIDVAASDLDGDGQADLVVFVPLTNTIATYLNTTTTMNASQGADQ